MGGLGHLARQLDFAGRGSHVSRHVRAIPRPICKLNRAGLTLSNRPYFIFIHRIGPRLGPIWPYFIFIH